MSIGSLFSGIGGLELGLEWAGLGPTLWQVEREPFCAEILARHWPRATRFADVREVGKHNLAPVDVLCGGFPCQPSSTAGKRQGRADERWLWPQFARIIRELQPRVVVAENVPGLLSVDGGRAFGEVLGDLADAGYSARWFRLGACDVGAPHRRLRIFIVAWRGVADTAGARRDGSEIPTQHVLGSPLQAARLGDSRRLADANGERGREERQPAVLLAPVEGAPPRGSPLPGVGGAADGLRPWVDGPGPGWPSGPGEPQHAWEPPRVLAGVPQRAARLKALGNAVVPQVAYRVGLVVREVLGMPALPGVAA